MTWLLEQWRRRAGVRVRTALIAALTVAVTTVVGSVVFVAVLHRNLRQDVDLTLAQQAQTLAASVSHSGADSVDLAARLGDTNVVQLLDAKGTVVEASPELKGQPALTTLRPAPGVAIRSKQHLSLDEDADYRQEVLGAQDPSGARYFVVIEQSLEAAENSEKIVVGLLLIGSPLLAVLVAVIAYAVSGRALRSVELMRRQVAGIDASSLHARVPEPEAHDEVWRLAGTMNSMLDRLESASRAQRQFVSDASHELRSPLATVRTTLEVAQAHPEDVDWPGTVDVVLDEAARVEHLVSDLLLLAQSDERGLQLRRTDVDLDDIVTTEAARLRTTTGLTVTSHVDAVRIQGDHDRLARVVRNLADNAVRHATTSVDLRLEVSGEGAALEITDDGPGIPVADRERVFERFVRLDDSRSRARGGTGLGLAIVRQIVQAHEGDVHFVEGSRVRVTLPTGSAQRADATMKP